MKTTLATLLLTAVTLVGCGDPDDDFEEQVEVTATNEVALEVAEDNQSSPPVSEDIAACMTGGNVFHISAEGPGAWLMPGLPYTPSFYTSGPTADWIVFPFNDRTATMILVQEGPLGNSTNYYVSVSTEHRNGDLLPGLYDPTERFLGGVIDTMHPGLDTGVNGRGCNTSAGWFRIEEISWNGNILNSLTLSFVNRCGGAYPGVTGCLRYLASDVPPAGG